MATRKNRQDPASKKKQPAAPRRAPAEGKQDRKSPPPKKGINQRGGARVKYDADPGEPDFGGEIDQILTR